MRTLWMVVVGAVAAGLSASVVVAPVDAVTLDSIEVTPTGPSVPVGRTQQLTATGTYSDGSHLDLTDVVTWSSGSGNVVVSNAPGSRGLVTAVMVGSSTVSASYGGVSGSTSVTITAAVLESIAVTPNLPRIPVGRTQPLTATGTYSDGSHVDLTDVVTWSSGSGNVAVSNASGSQGLATAVVVGSSTVSASYGGVSGSTSVTVTSATLVFIQVTPVGPSVPAGRTQQLTATGVFSDGSSLDLTASVTWSSDPGNVSVSNAPGSQGVVTGLTMGSSTVTASDGGASGSATVTVTAALLESIEVTPAGPSVPLGMMQQLTAIGTYSDGSRQYLTAAVTWSSDTGNVVVSNAPASQGVVTAMAVGSAMVTASYGDVSGSTTVMVSPAGELPPTE